MKEINIKTLEAYNKKYSHCKSNLIKVSKKEVEDFDKQFAQLTKKGIVEKNYLLKSRKWVLIDNTYYEIPKAPRWTWFRNLNLGIQTAVAVFGVGAVTTAITVPTVLLNNKGGVKPQPEPEPVPPGPEPEPVETDKVINIWSKDTVISDTLLKEEVINEKDGKYFITNSSDYEVRFSTYSSNDELINKIKTETNPEEKVDLFVDESNDYEFMSDEISLDMSSVGFDGYNHLIDTSTNGELFPYTIEEGQTYEGKQKCLPYYIAPSLLIYRRSYLKDVFGTDDPDEVQKLISASIDECAAKFNAAGYYMTSGYGDTFKMYTGNDEPLVKGNKLFVPKNYKTWAEQCKLYSDKGYTKKHSMWSQEWNSDMYNDGKVVCFFGPEWFMDYTLKPENDDWGACCSPSAFNWGGSSIYIATSSTNKKISGKLITELFKEENVAKGYKNNFQIIPNNKVLKTFENKKSILQDENIIPYLYDTCTKMKASTIKKNKYSESLDQIFCDAMNDYFEGKVESLSDAEETFYKDALAKFPELTR